MKRQKKKKKKEKKEKKKKTQFLKHIYKQLM